MMLRARSAIAFAAALFVAGALHATTIVPLADAALVDRATLIVDVTVESRLPVVHERPATAWLVAIDRVLKGRADASHVVVRVPGGEGPDGMSLRIYGTPALAPGVRALLFLSPRADGTYALQQFPQGAFLAGRGHGRSLAFRDFSEVKVLGFGRAGAREPLRDLERFTHWIEDRVEGIQRTPDYVVRPARSEIQSLQQQFTLLERDGINMRWFAFDTGGSAPWRSHTTPMPNLAGGGVNELQRALGAWTNEPTTPVRLAYAGTSSATGGLDTYDFQNVVLWTDPNNEIEGVFDCGAGGTIALGGPWFDTSATRPFDGKLYYPIVNGDIIFQDGIDCKRFSSPSFSKFIEEVAAHELGHTLGLGHSSERPGEPNATLREALMYFRAHDDGRGARLNEDDVAALQTLYRVGGAIGGGGSSPPPSAGGCPPGAPADALCLLNGRFQVTGTWQNQFNGTTGAIKPIPNSDFAGFFYFTDPSNVELILKILDFGSEIKVFYSQLTNLKFSLVVKEVASGRVKSYTNTPGDCGAIDDNFLTGSSSTASSLSSASLANEPAAAGSCVASGTTLCLLDGRFAITVDWRNQFNGATGTGRPQALSRLTGAFSFDDPRNLELLIKTLQFPDRLLVLYGSLSNFEYTIRVTDTVAGRSKEYRNAAGNFCGGLDNSF
jgi:hypothetical protein